LCKGIYNKTWNISPSILVWEIWKERNRRTFQDLERPNYELINNIEDSIVETLNAYIRKVLQEEGSFSVCDSFIKKNWYSLINPPLIYAKKNKVARETCSWTPPPLGWTKLNFDGASRGNPGPAGIGCIIHDDSGKWLAKRANYIGPSTNNLTELEALQADLQLGLSLKLPNLIIEGDSQIILNAIRKRSTPNWVLNSKLEEVLKLLDQFDNTQILHIFREGNGTADYLANLGADGQNLVLFNQS
jgi:ribonuclease HI